tara:strand:- start:3457 stop:3648 length:192 start_codon:yes stop_codon:yes gene_type:complete
MRRNIHGNWENTIMELAEHGTHNTLEYKSQEPLTIFTGDGDVVYVFPKKNNETYVLFKDRVIK